MKRRSLWAALFGGTAAAQIADVQIDPKPRLMVQSREIHWFHDGKPLNNQCPVCGTMAEPYRPAKLNADGTSALFLLERIARCKLCNSAFWQDAEERNG